MLGEWAGGGDVGPDPVGLGPWQGAGRGDSLPWETVASQGLPQAAHAMCGVCTWTGPQQAAPPAMLAPVRPPGAKCWQGEVSGLAVAAPWGPGLPLGAADESRWPAATALGAGNAPSCHLMEEARSGGVESARFIFLRKRPRKPLQSSGELALSMQCVSLLCHSLWRLLGDAPGDLPRPSKCHVRRGPATAGAVRGSWYRRVRDSMQNQVLLGCAVSPKETLKA